MRAATASTLLLCLLLLTACSASRPEPISTVEPATDAAPSPFGLTPETYELVRAESSPGGRLDFEAGLEDGTLFEVGGFLMNKREYALALWGMAARQLGVRSEGDAVALYLEVGPLDVARYENYRSALVFGYELESEE